jgi:hypothetical protein
VTSLPPAISLRDFILGLLKEEAGFVGTVMLRQAQHEEMA